MASFVLIESSLYLKYSSSFTYKKIIKIAARSSFDAIYHPTTHGLWATTAEGFIERIGDCYHIQWSHIVIIWL